MKRCFLFLLVTSVCALLCAAPTFFGLNWTDPGGGGGGTADLIDQQFEGTGAPTPWGGDGNFDNTTATVLEGSQQVYLNASKEAYILNGEGINHGEVWGRFRARFPVAASDFIAITLKDLSYASMCLIYRKTDGTFLVSTVGGTASTTTAIPDDTNCYIWFHYAKGSGSNAVLEVHISTSSTKPADASAGHAKVSNGTSTVNIGCIGFAATATEAIYMDDFKLSSTGAIP